MRWLKLLWRALRPRCGCSYVDVPGRLTPLYFYCEKHAGPNPCEEWKLVERPVGSPNEQVRRGGEGACL